MLACFPTRSAKRNRLSEKQRPSPRCSGRTISQWLTLRTGGRLHAVRPLEYIGCRLVASSCLAWTRLTLLRMDMACTVTWFPAGLFRICRVDLRICRAVCSWQLFTSFRKGMPSLTAFNRARCLHGERFECQQNFQACSMSANVCWLFMVSPAVLFVSLRSLWMPGSRLPCCHCGRLGAAAPSNWRISINLFLRKLRSILRRRCVSGRAVTSSDKINSILYQYFGWPQNEVTIDDGHLVGEIVTKWLYFRFVSSWFSGAVLAGHADHAVSWTCLQDLIAHASKFGWECEARWVQPTFSCS